MKRLDTLTSEQEAMLPVIRDEWLSIGLSTQPADREKAVAAARVAYARANLKEPQMIVWLNSPLAGAIGAHLLASLKNAQVRDQVGDQVWDQVCEQVRVQVGDQVRAQVGEQVRGQVWGQVRAQVRDQVGARVWAQVRAQVWDQVWRSVWAQVGGQVGDQVGRSVRDQVWAQVGGQVEAQVEDQVWAQVRAQVGEQVGEQGYRCGYGMHDASWIGFYETVRRFGVDISAITGLSGLTQSCGWYWPFTRAIILTERPTSLSRNARHQLHNESDMAISYPDGWGLYCLNGVRVPAQIVRTPAEKMDCQFILKERNAEIRREFVRKAGIEKVCRDLGARRVDQQDAYELLLLNIGDGRERPYLKMKNPSIGVYHIEGVAPECRTVRQALNWRNSLTDKEIDEVNGSDMYQQGDVILRPSNVKTFKSKPVVLT